MENKKGFIKFSGLLLICIGYFGLSFSSALQLKLTFPIGIQALDENIIKEKIIPIHFADYDNDFGGFFYFSNLDESTEGLENFTMTTEIEDNYNAYSVKTHDDASDYKCSKMVEGFYYNAERGERLWPLNSGYWAGMIKGLVTTGGLYFDCFNSKYLDELKDCKEKFEKNEQEMQICMDNLKNKFKSGIGSDNGYYGSIEQSYSGQQMNLIAGINYSRDTSVIPFITIESGSKLSPTFIRLDNRYPIGFIYDYNGGVGFVGCRIAYDKAPGDIRSIVNRAQISGLSSMFIFDRNIIFTGLNLPIGDYNKVVCSGVSQEDTMLNFVVEGIMGMSNSLAANSAYEAISNWSDEKMQGFSTQNINNSTLLNYARKRAEILCRGKWKNKEPNFVSEKITCIENPSRRIDGDKFKNKTLIVKNGDVEISPNNTPSSNDFNDIFIDKGDLIILERSGSEIRTGNVVFTRKGSISERTGGDFIDAISGAYAHGLSYTGEDVAIGSYINGNFIVNGNVKSNETTSGYLYNRYFIYGKFVTKDTIEQLKQTFAWRCIRGYTNEESTNYCPQSHDDWKNPYQNASLVIIDKTFDSPLLK